MQWILVLSSNAKRTEAHQFYEALGFKQHGISFHAAIETSNWFPHTLQHQRIAG